MSGASVPYLLGSEIPNSAVREKTQALGTSWNVVWAFVTNYVIPYIINNIHFKVGWVFGSISVLALLFTFFFLPETKVSLACSTSLMDDKLMWNALYRVAHLRKLMPSLKSLTTHSVLLIFNTPMLSTVLANLTRRKSWLALFEETMTLLLTIVSKRLHVYKKSRGYV